jgi:NAD-dependent SIR2 family protein deacetylase
MKLTSRMNAIEDELRMLMQLSGGKETPRIKELMTEYQGEMKKLEEEDAYWELHGDDDDMGCSYWCPKCGFNTPEEAFWSSDFKDFNPLPSCPKCGAKLKA